MNLLALLLFAILLRPGSGEIGLTADRTEHDFGDLLWGESPRTRCTLRNDSTEPITLTLLRSNCACLATRMWIAGDEVAADVLAGEGPLGVVQPGGEVVLELGLDTAAQRAFRDRPTVIHKGIRLQHSASRRPFVFMMRANMETSAWLEPPEIDLGNVRKTEGGQTSATLRGLRLGSFRITRVDTQREGITATCTTLEGGENPSFRIDLEIEKGAPVGPYGGPVLVHLDHPKVPLLHLPMKVFIQSAIELDGNAGAGRLDFGELDRTGGKTMELNILNHEPAVPYHVQGAELEAQPGPEHFSWEIVEDEPGVRLRLRLTVSEDSPRGPFHGKLRLLSEHPDLPRRVVLFRGRRR